MAIKNIIAKGIGFAPGTKKWIPTHGFSSGATPSTPFSGFMEFHSVREDYQFKSVKEDLQFRTVKT